MTASALLLKTPCHAWHAGHGGRLVEFGGWEMPVQYTTIIAEHQAVRKDVGLFDIAHMGRLYFRGADAERFVNHLVTNDVSVLKTGQICYALLVQENGGVLDDVLVYRRDDAWMLVVNASNRLKVLAWIAKNRGGFDVQIEDATLTQGMLAIQGPRAEALLRPLTAYRLDELEYYWGCPAEVNGQAAYVSRTGYTGEAGFEIIVSTEATPALWETLIAAGATAAGLGCRDTLRLEAAMPLYGHELNEDVDPLTAGLGFAVKLSKSDFIGRSALAALKEQITLKRVGLELDGKRIAREGAAIESAGRRIGQVTSGTFSPTLERTIAMGYVDKALSGIGTALEVDIRGQKVAARVVKLPFYKRS